MRRCSHSLSTASALRSIFFPTSSQTCVSTFLAPSYAPDAPSYSLRLRSSNLHTAQAPYAKPAGGSRPFSAPLDELTTATAKPTPARPVSTAAAAELRKFGAQADRRPKDEEIQARSVLLVGGLSGQEKGPAEQASVAAVLARLDRQTHCLVQVGRSEDEYGNARTTCRVMERRAYFEYEQRRGKPAAGGSKPPAARPAKQLELGWAIDANDLEHRLRKALEFLAAGRKVEVILAPKKKAKLALPEDCARLVRTIREKIIGVGYKEAKPMEGKIGAMVTLYFEPKPQA